VPDAYTWNGEPMELPIQGLARLTRDEGRGMMGTTGELDPVYDKYLHTLDLDELKFALSLQPNSLKVVQFLSDLVNPIKADTNITTLAKQRGIGQTEMMEIWRSYKLSHALGVYIDAAPNLAGHVAKDAESIKICCPRCDGAGVILVTRRDNEQAWIDCPTCESTGAVRRPGDKASRDLVFHAIGMVKSGGSGNVTVNVQQNAQGVESVIDELDRITPVIDLPPALPEDDD
jgi:hypothetical protein